MNLPAGFSEGMRLSASRDMQPMLNALRALSGIGGVGVNASVNNDGVNLRLANISKAWKYAIPIYVRNTGSEQLNPYEPATIEGTMYEDEASATLRNNYITDSIVLNVRRPTTGDTAGNFVICAEYIPASAGGVAWHMGLMPCFLVNMQSLSTLDFAELEPSKVSTLTLPPYALNVTPTGSARVIYAPSTVTTTQVLGIIQIGGGRPSGTADRAEFWARITGATAQNGNGTGDIDLPSTQWKYSWDEVEKTSTGYSTGASSKWEELDDGRNSDDGLAYNTFEDRNSTAGTQGNGVTYAYLDVDGDDEYEFYLQPIQTGVVVRMREVIVPGTPDTTEYWFAHPNGVDGFCDREPEGS